MLWIKAFHIVFMVTWFAGLFYLPRLFVYHAMSSDKVSIERFEVMERKLYYGIMTPGAIATLAFGIWLLLLGGPVYFSAAWMHAKLSLVLILIAYHVYLGYLRQAFVQNRNQHTHRFYRWINEFPVLLLVAIVVLVVVKPF